MDVEERKLATMLFADLVGSTELADSQDPERIRALLNRFYDAMTEEVDRAGGTVENFAGDAVMAAFGAPAALEDHAERALHAALAMLRRTKELDERLELRIGVNTGEVVVGRPREGSSFVTGDPVNVAARLEQGASPGEILVGERTVAAVRGAFEFDEEQTIEAKGKRGGVRCRRLVRAVSLMRPRGVGALGRAFVGREEELDRLWKTYAGTVESRRPRLVTVLGDSGVGKTRLIREFWAGPADQEPEPLRLTGRCLSYGAGITYWALGEVLKEHLGLLETDPPERVLELLGERQILGMALGLDVTGGLHPLAARDRFQDAWSEFFTAAATERPVVVLVEDIHWAEDQLLDLLEHALATSDGPLLLVATARPELLERRPGWGTRADGVRLELEPLSADESVLMLDELLAGSLPDELRELVVQRAEGNPFFVEELLGMLIDRGLLGRDNGNWTLHELPPEFAVPDSVHAVLAARIDLLGPAEKAALQAAAVIGRVFWTGPVYELVEVEPDLRVLEERDLIRLRAGSSIAGEREYAIKHTLTREVAYAGLPKARRARLHAAFAAWLERLGEDRDDLAALLAHHYSEAVRPEDADLAWADDPDQAERLRAQAVHWLRAAASLAVTRYELDDSLALLQRALELEPDDQGRAAIWREIGRAHALNYAGEDFWTAMERSLELSSDATLSGETYAELALQTSIRGGMWSRAPDDELVDGWIEQALELADPHGPARVKALTARTFWHRPHSIDTAVEAAQLADRLGDPELRALAYTARSYATFAAFDFDEAMRWADNARALETEVRDPDLLVELYFNALPPSVARGDFDRARALAGHHDELNSRLSSHHRVHGVAVMLEVEEQLGGWDRIASLTGMAENRVEENLSTPCVRNSRSLFLCALANTYAGNPSEARRLEERAEELSFEGFGLTLDGPRIRLAISRGELEKVERLVTGRSSTQAFYLGSQTALLDGLAAIGDRERVEEATPRLLEPGTYLEPFALRALGLVREDQQLVDQAAERFEALGLAWHAEQTRKLVAQP
jgi:class 3 adenylate cyclase